MDGHTSHTGPYAMEWMLLHNVDYIGMPPHTSHFLQPLDVGVFGPVKTKHVKLIKVIKDVFPNQVLDYSMIAPAFLLAYFEVAMNRTTIQNCFKACGVFPGAIPGDPVWVKIMNGCVDSCASMTQAEVITPEHLTRSTN